MNAMKKSVLITLITLSMLVTTVLAATKSSDVMMKLKVEYVLPFPGILPDNPLYFLKAGRDRIMDFLIVDPVRKAEFYILQADKRLGMATMLLDKGNTTLAETTLSKGETYMDKAVSTLVNLKRSGKEIPGYLVDRLTRSVAKHGEVITERSATVAEPAKGFLAATAQKVKKLQAEAEKVK